MTRSTHNRAAPGVSVRRVRDQPVVEFGAVEGYGPIFNAGALHPRRQVPSLRPWRARSLPAERRRRGAVPRLRLRRARVRVRRRPLVRVSAGARRELAGRRLLLRGSARAARPDAAAASGSSCRTRTCRRPRRGKSWRIGLHDLGYEDGRFFLNRTSGRVVGPGRGAEQGRGDLQPPRRPSRADPPHPPEHAARRVRLARRALRSAGRATGTSTMATSTGTRSSGRPRARSASAPARRPSRPPTACSCSSTSATANEHYTTRVALLDDDTGRVRSLLPEPIMRPSSTWERDGDVDNVVFVQGAVPQPDGTIYLTYGAADRCVGAATVSTEELLAALLAAA